MNIIVFLVVGLIAGFLANKLMKGNMDILPSLVLGVVGAIVGGFLFRLLGFMSIGLISQIITATVGAVICLAAWRAYKRR